MSYVMSYLSWPMYTWLMWDTRVPKTSRKKRMGGVSCHMSCHICHGLCTPLAAFCLVSALEPMEVTMSLDVAEACRGKKRV